MGEKFSPGGKIDGKKSRSDEKNSRAIKGSENKLP